MLSKRRYSDNRVPGRIMHMIRARAIGGLCTLAGMIAAATAVHAQAPRPLQDVPYPSQQRQAQQRQAYPAQQPSAHQLRCMQLEQELANDWTRRQQGRDQLPQIEAEIRKYDRVYQQTQRQVERSGCYKSNFLFGRSLVRTPKCMRLHRKVEDARKRLASLQEQKTAVRNPRSQRQRKDELISALARAGCGSQYQQESRRRGNDGGGWFTSFFQDDSYRTRREDLQTSRIEPFATYRTLCVRTCDGYYFPVSYSTLPSRFSTDIAQCQSQCAAPAELFVYRNPGEEAEQAVSADGRTAYNDLPHAFRYRKEYVKGCSCKTAEYDPAEIELANQKAETEATDKKAGTVPSGKVAQDPKQVPQQQ